MTKIINCVNCEQKLEIPAATGNWEITCPDCGGVFIHSNSIELIDDGINEKIQKELLKIKNFVPRVGVFGDTGVGKSSLCNALFGKEVAKISNVLACTRKPQEILMPSEGGGGIVLVDVPGIGEDKVRHKEYVDLYKSLAPGLDLILWAIRSDDRKYMSSIDVYEELQPVISNSCPVIFVVTQVDKIDPGDEWYEGGKKDLGKTQKKNLGIKMRDISKRFNVAPQDIIPVSASGAINLVELVNRIVEALPNQKKFSITREAKRENVSEEASQNAKKGIVDHLKDVLSVVVEVVTEVVVKVISEKIRSWWPW